ncbi:DUF4230 domain-containing protein [Lewinella sp. W8]|uniref:DUF4230 domain-containing protein n=1 Tax=Lewinella sp. W8 TaxID=2528208 RepID=UPI0010685DF3|nr:DUF4230 domain-containing protein [Lewinella sp. W8]MTB51947.1 DUF4230 domain-containing protein [Lewinella sp. W8]
MFSRLGVTLIVAALAFFLGGAVFWGFNQDRHTEKESSTVLLERVRNVLKLVTVEGDVSELYHSDQAREVTLYLPLPARFSFRKQASVEVRGTVLVGYDLEQLQLRVDESQQRVYLQNLPEPEILAVDHELIYRDLNESWFNSFTAEDYSELNRKAKEKLREKALESKLLEAAREQGDGVLETVAYLVEGAGYELVLEGQAPPREVE